jgi:hypothetical protein
MGHQQTTSIPYALALGLLWKNLADAPVDATDDRRGKIFRQVGTISSQAHEDKDQIRATAALAETCPTPNR